MIKNTHNEGRNFLFSTQYHYKSIYIKGRVILKKLIIVTLITTSYGDILATGSFLDRASSSIKKATEKTEDLLKKTYKRIKPTEVTLTGSSEDKFEGKKNKRTIDLKLNYKMVQPKQSETTPRITVWVHGTKSTKITDDITTARPPKPGLQEIAPLSDTVKIKGLAQATSTSDPANYPFEHSYAFGWSGDLAFDARIKAATDLHKQLKELVSTYTKKYDKTPFIRLITHSHGGNVALDLATVNEKDQDKTLFIDEMILLACPVQHVTKALIESPLFGKIYSLYSLLDMIQVLDPQKAYIHHTKAEDKELFSQRRFPDSKKLIQVELALGPTEKTAIGPMHIGFITKNMTKRLPAIIKYLDQWEKEQPHTAQEIRKLTILTPLLPSRQEGQAYALEPVQQQTPTEAEPLHNKDVEE